MESRRDRLESGALAQPRPALGLRPWFALLRRARSLRRFAFAMPERVTVALGYGAWRAERVRVATTFSSRLFGMNVPDVSALLIHTRSVHGGPLRVVHLTAEGTVVGAELLAGSGTVRARDYWMLELPVEAPYPERGVRLRVLPSSKE